MRRSVHRSLGSMTSFLLTIGLTSLGEGLLRAGVVLHTHDATGVNDIITSLKTFSDVSSQAKSLVAPLVRSHDKLGDVSEELPDCKEVCSLCYTPRNP